MTSIREFLRVRKIMLEDILDQNKTKVEELREKAMRLQDDAIQFARDRKISESVGKYREAFYVERQVTDWYIQSSKPENEIRFTRTILCLSTAHLALDGGLDAEAKYYAEKVIQYDYPVESFTEQAKSILKHIIDHG